LCKIKYTFKDDKGNITGVNLDRYKQDVLNNTNKYMIYAVAKGYNSLDKALSMSLDEIYEAFEALMILEKDRGI